MSAGPAPRERNVKWAAWPREEETQLDYLNRELEARAGSTSPQQDTQGRVPGGVAGSEPIPSYRPASPASPGLLTPGHPESQEPPQALLCAPDSALPSLSDP